MCVCVCVCIREKKCQSDFDLPAASLGFFPPKKCARIDWASMPTKNDGNTIDSRVNIPAKPPVLSGNENARAHNIANVNMHCMSSDLIPPQQELVFFLLFVGLMLFAVPGAVPGISFGVLYFAMNL